MRQGKVRAEAACGAESVELAYRFRDLLWTATLFAVLVPYSRRASRVPLRVVCDPRENNKAHTRYFLAVRSLEHACLSLFLFSPLLSQQITRIARMRIIIRVVHHPWPCQQHHRIHRRRRRCRQHSSWTSRDSEKRSRKKWPHCHVSRHAANARSRQMSWGSTYLTLVRSSTMTALCAYHHCGRSSATSSTMQQWSTNVAAFRTVANAL